MKPTLEETMNQLKARLEESEYRHVATAEALENLVDAIDRSTFNHLYYWECKAAKKALNGIEE